MEFQLHKWPKMKKQFEIRNMQKKKEIPRGKNIKPKQQNQSVEDAMAHKQRVSTLWEHWRFKAEDN